MLKFRFTVKSLLRHRAAGGEIDRVYFSYLLGADNCLVERSSFTCRRAARAPDASAAQVALQQNCEFGSKVSENA